MSILDHEQTEACDACIDGDHTLCAEPQTWQRTRETGAYVVSKCCCFTDALYEWEMEHGGMND